MCVYNMIWSRSTTDWCGLVTIATLGIANLSQSHNNLCKNCWFLWGFLLSGMRIVSADVVTVGMNLRIADYVPCNYVWRWFSSQACYIMLNLWLEVVDWPVFSSWGLTKKADPTIDRNEMLRITCRHLRKSGMNRDETCRYNSDSSWNGIETGTDFHFAH
jgi:hypothetical protein